MVVLGKDEEISLYIWDEDNDLPTTTEYDPDTPTSTIKCDFTPFLVRGWLTGKIGGKGTLDATFDGCGESTLLRTKGNKVIVVVGSVDTSSPGSNNTDIYIPFYGYINETDVAGDDKIRIKCNHSITDSDGSQLGNKFFDGIKSIGLTVNNLLTNLTQVASFKPNQYDDTGEGEWKNKVY